MERMIKGSYRDIKDGFNYKYVAFVEKTNNGWKFELNYTEYEMYFSYKVSEKSSEFITGTANTKKQAIQAYKHEAALRYLGENYEQKLEDLYESL